MRTSLCAAVVVALFLAAAVPAPAQRRALDTRPAFMQIVTNYVVETRTLIVTNTITVTNAVVATNFYNAQGVLLQPVPPTPPPFPGLIPIPPQPQPALPPLPVAPDPAVVKAQQLHAVRDLLTTSVAASSNDVAVTGSFTSNVTHQIRIPQGVTSLDRKKTEALVTAMNVTAEKAAPVVLALLMKEAAQYQTDDPAALLKGASDAATRAFLAGQKEALEPQVLAAVQQAGAEPKLREAYNNVMLKGGGLLGSVLWSGPTVDIETHVAQGVWQAIANQMATEEALIRADPKARPTPALQDAFK